MSRLPWVAVGYATSAWVAACVLVVALAADQTYAKRETLQATHSHARSLSTAPPECGVFMENTDLGVPGENLRGSGRITSTPEECLGICEATATCNAAIRVYNGGCYLKAVDASTVARVPRALMTSFLICDDGNSIPSSPSVETPGPAPEPTTAPVPAPDPATDPATDPADPPSVVGIACTLDTIGFQCDDGLDVCTVNDTCKETVIFFGAPETEPPIAVCRGDLAPGRSCFDSDPCSKTIACSAPDLSPFLPGTPPKPPAPPTETDIPCNQGGDDCSDYLDQPFLDFCSTFQCKPCTGCNAAGQKCFEVAVEIGSPCNDRNFCTTNDSCQPYFDNYDEPFLTDDGEPRASCQGEFVGDGVSCDDYDDECTINDKCIQLRSFFPDPDSKLFSICSGEIPEGRSCKFPDPCSSSILCSSPAADPALQL